MSESIRTNETSDSDTSQVAREQGQQLKDSAQGAASDVAGTTGDRARVLKDEAGAHARGITGDVQRQVHDRADQEARRAGSALSQAGTQLQALAEGRVDEAGVFGEYAQQAARALNRWADNVQDRGLDGMLDDLRSIARRQPGAFLLGALAAGVVAGRFGRNLRGEMSDSSEGGHTALQSSATSGESGAGEPGAGPQQPGFEGARAAQTQRPTTPPPADALRDDVVVGGRRADYPPADADRRSMP